MKDAILIAISIFCAMLLFSGCDKASKAADTAQSGAAATIPASDGQADGKMTNQHADGHDHEHGTDMHGDESVTKSTSPATGHPYTLASCPVSGEELGSMGDPIRYSHEGRDIAFCCQACVPKFEADPAKYIAEIDKQMIEQQMATYPLDSCPVTGDKLGGMGESINIIHDNRLVRFCCEDCVQDFKADPARYFSMIDAAVIEQQAAGYPLETCVVSGEKLGEEGSVIDYVVGSTLIRLCCEDCKHDVDANPAMYLEMVHAAEGDTA